MFDDFTGQYQDTVVDASGNVSILNDFVSAAEAKIDGALAPLRQAKTDQANIGGALFEAIYQFGAGRVDAARERAVDAFLRTGEGKKAQAIGVQQTLQKYLPFIIAAIVGVFLLGFALRR